MQYGYFIKKRVISIFILTTVIDQKILITKTSFFILIAINNY